MSDSVGSVSVEVVPDASGWSEKLRAQIRDVTAKVRVDAETAEADAELDKVARTRTAKVKADTSQLSKGNETLASFVDRLGVLPALAVAAGAALVPLAATIGGLAVAIGAPLAIAGGGATLFAFLAGLAAKDTSAQLKNVDSLQKKLSGLKKGTAEYAATQKELTKAQGALTPSQVAYGKSLDGLKASFAGLLTGKSGQALLGTLASGMDLLSKTLPLTAPLLISVGHGFSTLLGDLDHAASGKGFQRFVDFLAHQAGHDIVAFGRIAGNGIKGITGILLGLDHALGGSVLHGLGQLSQKFADLGSGAGHSKWLREFVDYFHRVGPQVGSTLSAIARAIGHIAAALAPLGPVVLSGLTHAANALSSIPIPVLTALAAATAGLVGFGKLGGFKATGFAINKLTSGQGIAGGLIGATKVVPVYVTNKGFGGEGGPKGLLSKVKGALPTTAAGAEGTAALTAPEIAAMVGLFTTGVFAQGVLTQSERHGFANYGKHTVTPPGMYGNGTGYVDPPGQQHFHFPNFPPAGQIHDATAFDALRAHAASASQTIDRIGPNAANSLAVAQRAVAALQNRINAIHDHPFKVIAQTQAAVTALEHLQSLTIRDKHFTVTELFQQRERAVGPGGGIQHHALGGLIRGAGSGSSDSVPSWLSNGEFVVNAAATSHNRRLLEQLNRGMYRPPPMPAYTSPAPAGHAGGNAGGNASFPSSVTLKLEDGTQLRAYVERHADGVYHANQRYDHDRRGQ